jgi:hypothetical protein
MSEYYFHETKFVGGRKRKIYKKGKSRKHYLKKKGKFIQLDKKTKDGGGQTPYRNNGSHSLPTPHRATPHRVKEAQSASHIKPGLQQLHATQRSRLVSTRESICVETRKRKIRQYNEIIQDEERKLVETQTKIQNYNEMIQNENMKLRNCSNEEGGDEPVVQTPRMPKIISKLKNAYALFRKPNASTPQASTPQAPSPQASSPPASASIVQPFGAQRDIGPGRVDYSAQSHGGKKKAKPKAKPKAKAKKMLKK